MSRYTTTNPHSIVAVNKSVLWESAERLRSNLEASDYKHIVLGLIGLKFTIEFGEKSGLKINPAISWTQIFKDYNRKEIGVGLNNSIEILENENPSLKDVFPRVYEDPDLDQKKLFHLVETFDREFVFNDDSESDTFGEVYEYFLGKFAEVEGRRGGEFFTPREVVELMLKCIRPKPQSSIYDPCCGSGGMFVRSHESYGLNNKLEFYGQEAVGTTWRLCKMNMIVRGLQVNIGERCADTFSNNVHNGKKFDYVFTNPPFNLKEWGGPFDDERWFIGKPSKGNANFAWIQHIIHHLKETGKAAFVMTNSVLSTDHKSAVSKEIDLDSSEDYGAGVLRRELIKLGILDAIIRLPNKIFLNTPIPACIWIIDKEKAKTKRHREVLMIDIREMGSLISKSRRVISTSEIDIVSNYYTSWKSGSNYEDISGICKSVTFDEISRHRYSLVPGRYIGYTDDFQLPETTTFNEDLTELCNLVENTLNSWGDSIDTVRRGVDG